LSSPLLFILTQLLNIVFLFIITLLLVVTHTFKLGTNTTSTYCIVIHHHLVAHFTSLFFLCWWYFVPTFNFMLLATITLWSLQQDSLCTSKRWDFYFFLFVCGFGVYKL
jgi:hypothetical protein